MEIKSSDGIQVDWFFPRKSFDKEKEGQGLVKESTSWWWKEGEIARRPDERRLGLGLSLPVRERALVRGRQSRVLRSNLLLLFYRAV